MQSERLYHRVQIMRASEQPNSYGAGDLEWQAVANVRAFIRHKGGDLALDNGEIFAGEVLLCECNEYVYKVVRRYDRIVVNGDTYRIEAIELNRTTRRVILTCTLNNE